MAVGLFDGTIYHRQSQPGASSKFLGGKKWLKNAFLSFLTHANARVSYRNAFIRTRTQTRTTMNEFIAEHHLIRRNGKLTTFRHRVA